MTAVRVNYGAAINYLERIPTARFNIQPLVDEDLRRMVEIMRQYASSAFNYTDVAIMAMSKQLNIRLFYTFDYRDFRIFRPRHCDYLELLS